MELYYMRSCQNSGAANGSRIKSVTFQNENMIQRNYTYLLITISLLAVACQKELNDPNGDPAGTDSTVAGLITRYASSTIRDNFEWHVQEFSYGTGSNSGLEKRFSIFRIKDLTGTIKETQGTQIFFRDVNGRVTRFTATSDQGLLEYRFNYTGSGQIQSLVSSLPAAGNMMIDSVVYSYSSTNKVTRMDFYQKDPVNPSLLLLQAYETYTWDAGGNLETRKTYNGDPVSGFILGITYSYAYDTKPNPLYHETLKIPFLPYEWLFHSPHNFREQQNDYSSPFVQDDGLMYNLEYNADGMPVSWKKTNDTLSVTKYRYQ